MGLGLAGDRVQAAGLLHEVQDRVPVPLGLAADDLVGRVEPGVELTLAVEGYSSNVYMKIRCRP